MLLLKKFDRKHVAMHSLPGSSRAGSIAREYGPLRSIGLLDVMGAVVVTGDTAVAEDVPSVFGAGGGGVVDGKASVNVPLGKTVTMTSVVWIDFGNETVSGPVGTELIVRTSAWTTLLRAASSATRPLAFAPPILFKVATCVGWVRRDPVENKSTNAVSFY